MKYRIWECWLHRCSRRREASAGKLLAMYSHRRKSSRDPNVYRSRIPGERKYSPNIENCAIFLIASRSCRMSSASHMTWPRSGPDERRTHQGGQRKTEEEAVRGRRKEQLRGRTVDVQKQKNQITRPEQDENMWEHVPNTSSGNKAQNKGRMCARGHMQARFHLFDAA